MTEIAILQFSPVPAYFCCGWVNSPIYVFGVSVTNVVIWHYFGKDLRQFLKKNNFHPSVPPLVFG